MHFRKEMSDRALSDAQVDLFVREGFVKLENAFSKETAAEAREILWREVGCDPEDRKTWTRPVLRLGDMAQEPFRQAANTEVLHAAFDELVGKGRWAPRETLGGIFHPVSASRGPRRYRLACGREFSSKRGGVAAEFVFRLADQSEIERAGTAAALLVLGYR